MVAVAEPARARRGPGWVVVLEQELRDLWLGGRGLLLSLGFSVLLSLIAYLLATNTDLNFLEQRESVSLTLQVAIAVGGLLTLLAAADAVSGERERGTLETLLLTPLPRRGAAIGKFLAAISLWLAAFALSLPYIWVLGRDVGNLGDAIAAGLAVGTVLAVFLCSLGLLVSLFVDSNRVSLAVSLFALIALFAPTQLPSGAQKGWAGDLLVRLDPISAGEEYVSKIVVSRHAWGQDASLLVSPVAWATVLAVAALLSSERFLRLRGGLSR